MTSLEFAAVPLYLYGLLRLTNTWRIFLVQLTRPLVLLVLAWCAWNLVSLCWSVDRADGLNDLSKARFLGTAAALWWVMDHRRWLIGALAAGFLLGNAAQFADLAATQMGLGWFDWHQPEDRYSGWWKPAVAGSLLVGALGLHLPAAFMGAGRTRWIAAACAVVTALGLLATGTRGAWIAGAALVVLTGAVGVFRAVGRRAHERNGAAPGSAGEGGRRIGGWWRAGIAIGAILVLLAGGYTGWRSVGPSVTRRFELARDELRAAWRGDYSSFTGQRLLMSELALEAFVKHPLGGVGVGGYQAWTTERRRADPRPESAEARARPFPHAHNTLLHAAATTGAPGLVLSILIIAVALRGALSREQLGPEGLGSYAAGPGFAMIGLLLVSMFDSVQVNAPTVALITTLFVMSLLPPPRTPEWARGKG